MGAARGFTLVEQLVAISLAGAASVTALPALVDFPAEAQSVALRSLAAAATSAGVLNQAGCLVTQQVPIPGKCQPVADCQQVAGLLMVELPAGHHILPGALGTGANGAEASCTLQRDSDGATATFRGVSAGL
ncbi:MAG: hypothetical protein CFE45_30225 [Burkholderiales bacterium PBB5]|nr:MAG: hypothetical protein CFE45_30225 [Burkholderiales bacterium PBB5]